MTTAVKAKEFFIRRGNKFIITDEVSTEIHDVLPGGNYMVGVSDTLGYFYEQAQPFELPPKYYGEITAVGERIRNTYLDRLKQGKPTGVLLRGEKGGGKTLLAKKLATDLARDLGLPTVMVNVPFYDDDFKGMLAGLGPSVVIFDEFEKVYSEKPRQEELLTLLDGVFNAKSLFFVIVNDEYKLTDALMNRPGRLFYSLEYKGLSSEFITDYCKDKLTNQAHLTSVLTVTAFFVNFNFDMLQGLVEEMNRYNEPAHEAVKFLNCKAEIFRAHEMFDVEVIVKGQKIPVVKGQERAKGHPFGKSYLTLSLDPTPKQRQGIMKGLSTYMSLTQDMVTGVDQENEKFTYTNGPFEITFTRNGNSGWNLEGEAGPSRYNYLDV